MIKYGEDDPTKIAVISFYSFVDIPEPDLLSPKILLVGKKKSIKGTVLVANEGFNGSISGNESDLRLLINEISKLTNAEDVSIKVNYCDKPPFSRFKVKLKEEIVSLKAGKIDVNNLKGEYIEPDKWDDFIKRDDVITIDTRNDYEVEEGTFAETLNPHTDTFRQFPQWVEENKELLKDKKIAMYCTGGIRCEKSTAFMKKLGYKEVYHLKGGILQYLEDTNNKNGAWQGNCFVFDDRRSVDKDLTPKEN